MIFASNNKGKIREIKNILKDFEIKSLKEAKIDIDVVEDGATFFDNALKKARAIYDLAKEPVLADDSGLCVIALDNWPGVYSHRFIGENASSQERNAKIINQTNTVKDRSANVVCCLVYYDGQNIISTTGEIIGKITKEPRGENGFGFDCIFETQNGKTMAELSQEEKDLVSARGLACKKMLAALTKENLN